MIDTTLLQRRLRFAAVAAFAWIKARWCEASTKIGLILTAVSAVAPTYASVDVRFAYAGAVAGILLAIWKEKPNGQ